jgi:hypothetical protein
VRLFTPKADYKEGPARRQVIGQKNSVSVREISLSLAPKVPLGAHFREAPLREDPYPEPISADANIADAKRSFAELRVQAKSLDTRKSAAKIPDPIKLPLTAPRGNLLEWNYE